MRRTLGGLATCLCLATTAMGSDITNVNATEMALDGPPNTIAEFLGGSAAFGLGTDENNERRVAMDSIPNAFDWAYWDPGSVGDDDPTFVDPNGNPENRSAYHDGRQVQWESKFSTPSVDGSAAPNGTISPLNLDSLGAGFNLDSGDFVVSRQNDAFRVSDNGRLGLQIAPPDGQINGEMFTLEMNIPDGEYLVSLFYASNEATASINFPGVTEVLVPPIPDGDDEVVLQFEVLNDSGSDQTLTFKVGDLLGGLTEMEVNFAAAVIQTVVPEPSSALLALAAPPLSGIRRVRRS